MAQFGNALYPTTEAMLDAMVDEYLVASAVAATLESNSDEQLAHEMVRDMELDVVGDITDPEGVSHMTAENYKEEELVKAFARYRAKQKG